MRSGSQHIRGGRASRAGEHQQAATCNREEEVPESVRIQHPASEESGEAQQGLQHTQRLVGKKL